jgi:hypothetical protein
MHRHHHKRKKVNNNAEIKEGNYVYIPSSSKIMMFHEGEPFVKKTMVLDKPVYVLYLGESETNTEYGKVFYEGKIWHSNKNNIYPGKENEKH